MCPKKANLLWGIKPRRIEKIWMVLKTNNTLKVLDWRANSIGAEGAKKIAEKIKG